MTGTHKDARVEETREEQNPRDGAFVEVGLNLLFLHPGLSGVGTYAQYMVRALLEEARAQEMAIRFHIFTSAAGMQAIGPIPGDERVCVHLVRLDPRRKVRKLLVEQVWLRRKATLIGLDLLHSFDYTLVYGLSSGPPQIATVHDLNYLNFPKTFSWSQRLFRRLAIPLTIHRAETVVTISNQAAAEISEKFPRSEGKVAVVYNGFKPIERQRGEARAGRGKPSRLLVVGTLNRHKNHRRLLNAFAMLEELDSELIIVGQDYGLGASLKKHAEQLGVADRVHWLGFLSDDGLSKQFEAATVVVVPSLYEGFGMTPLEAMAYGRPVICSHLPVFHEILGRDVVYFDPHDSRDMAEKIELVLNDSHLQAALVDGGTRRARLFQWSAAARGIISVWNELSGISKIAGGRHNISSKTSNCEEVV